MPKPYPSADLSTNSHQESWQQKVAFDPTLATPFASGDVATRPMFTALLYNITFAQRWLTAADKTLIEQHQEHVVLGSTEFTLRNKKTDEDWAVRYVGPVTFTEEPADTRLWQGRVSVFGKQVSKMHITQIDVEDLGAGSDIADRPVFVNPKAVTINSISILTKGAPAGVDDSNTAVILVEDDASNQVVTKTYNTATQPPTSDAEDLGTITNGSLAALEHLLLSVTNGAAANLPAFTLAIEWYYTT
jgi:hypothetical protein